MPFPLKDDKDIRDFALNFNNASEEYPNDVIHCEPIVAFSMRIMPVACSWRVDVKILDGKWEKHSVFDEKEHALSVMKSLRKWYELNLNQTLKKILGTPQHPPIPTDNNSGSKT